MTTSGASRAVLVTAPACLPALYYCLSCEMDPERDILTQGLFWEKKKKKEL